MFIECLLCTGTNLGSLYKAIRWTAVWGGYYYYSHFTDDEAGAQRGCVTGPGNYPTQYLDSGSPAVEPVPLTTFFVACLRSQHQWRASAV